MSNNLLAFLNDDIQAVFAVYEEVQRAGQTEAFLELVIRLAEYAWKWDRKNYKFRLLELASDYIHIQNHHPQLYQALEREFAAVSDYHVENLHSRVRRRVGPTTMAKGIIGQGYGIVQAGESSLIESANALGNTETRAANRANQFEVAMLGTKVALGDLWHQLLNIEVQAPGHEPIQALPTTRPSRSSRSSAARAAA